MIEAAASHLHPKASKAHRKTPSEKHLSDVKMLRRHGKGSNATLALADKISLCEKGDRCGSGFCAECLARKQKAFVRQAADLLDRVESDVSVVSVVDCELRFAQGELRRERDMFADLRQKLQRAFAAAGVKWAVGGFDVSANEHATHRFSPHYRPHAWVIVPTSQIKRGEKIFRRLFPRSATVKKPVVIKAFDRHPRGLAYAVKTDFVRRISLPRQKSESGETTRRNTRDRPLLARQKLELATALDRIGLDARVFLHGLRVVVIDGIAQFERTK
jgi:hypothetical protein